LVVFFWGYDCRCSELVSKPHLAPDGCVVPRIEMLTYLRVRSAFNPRDALPSNTI
jgi:hypothetical protein